MAGFVIDVSPSYTFPAGTVNPRIMVDITNDGQQSSTDPVMLLNRTSGRITGGASFAASFGPGRYRAFTCVDFKGENFDIASVSVIPSPFSSDRTILRAYPRRAEHSLETRVSNRPHTSSSFTLVRRWYHH